MKSGRAREARPQRFLTFVNAPVCVSLLPIMHSNIDNANAWRRAVLDGDNADIWRRGINDLDSLEPLENHQR